MQREALRWKRIPATLFLVNETVWRQWGSLDFNHEDRSGFFLCWIRGPASSAYDSEDRLSYEMQKQKTTTTKTPQSNFILLLSKQSCGLKKEVDVQNVAQCSVHTHRACAFAFGRNRTLYEWAPTCTWFHLFQNKWQWMVLCFAEIPFTAISFFK